MKQPNRIVNRYLRHLLSLAVALTLASVAHAQTKIALVNLQTVFDGYWRTKQADIQIKDRKADFDKARKGLIDDYQKANEDYRKLVEAANDQAVSAEERDKRKKTAESKLLEIREIEQSVNQFDKQALQTLGDQQKRMRDTILREIRDLVNKKAVNGNYGLVLDSAAMTVNQTPVILFTTGLPDLTEEVLTQLNATAPSGAITTGDDAKDKDKDKPKDTKKDDKK